MANEITASASISVKSGQTSLGKSSGSKQFNQAAALGPAPGVVDVATTEADIAITPVSSPGWYYIENLDSTNYVQIGPKSAGAMVPWHRLAPGEFAEGVLDPGVVLRAKANVATCKVLVMVFNR